MFLTFLCLCLLDLVKRFRLDLRAGSAFFENLVLDFPQQGRWLGRRWCPELFLTGPQNNSNAFGCQPKIEVSNKKRCLESSHGSVQEWVGGQTQCHSRCLILQEPTSCVRGSQLPSQWGLHLQQAANPWQE